MSDQLPAQIDPIRLADDGIRLCGTLPDGGMLRLKELTLPRRQPGQVAVDLQFERTDRGARRLHGTIRTQVEMACKRCLKPVKVDLAAQPQFVLLETEDTESEESDSLIVGAPLSLTELVEDELLLAMPMSPGHAEEECAHILPVAAGKGKLPVDEKRVYPFAELRGLKDKKP